MFCTRCGTQLRDLDRYCSQCGRRTGVDPEPSGSSSGLALDKRNKKIAGVCAGFARYMGVDITLVRIVTLVLAFCTGIGFIAYPIAWILMPNELPPAPEPRRETVAQPAV